MNNKFESPYHLALNDISKGNNLEDAQLAERIQRAFNTRGHNFSYLECLEGVVKARKEVRAEFYGTSSTRVAYALSVLPALVDDNNEYDNDAWTISLHERFPDYPIQKLGGCKVGAMKHHGNIRPKTRLEDRSRSVSNNNSFEYADPSNCAHIVDIITEVIGKKSFITENGNFEEEVFVRYEDDGRFIPNVPQHKTILTKLRCLDKKHIYAIELLDDVITGLTTTQIRQVPVLVQFLIINKQLELYCVKDGAKVVLSDITRVVNPLPVETPIERLVEVVAKVDEEEGRDTELPKAARVDQGEFTRSVELIKELTEIYKKAGIKCTITLDTL